jgi:hypothetical protein
VGERGYVLGGLFVRWGRVHHNKYQDALQWPCILYGQRSFKKKSHKDLQKTSQSTTKTTTKTTTPTTKPPKSALMQHATQNQLKQTNQTLSLFDYYYYYYFYYYFYFYFFG